MGNNHQRSPHTVKFDEAVVLLGHAEVTSRNMQRLIDSGVPLICADGGAFTALEFGLVPECIIGDMDSFSGPYGGQIIHITEQDTTDFEKCIYTVDAPLYMCFGFLGGRVDHGLTNLSVLARYPDKAVILIGDQDVCFCCPDHLDIDLPKGTRVSVFPMGPTKMQSTGLKWPLDGLDLSPTTRIATSNKACDTTVSLTKEQGDAVVILPIAHLDAVTQALANR